MVGKTEFKIMTGKVARTKVGYRA